MTGVRLFVGSQGGTVRGKSVTERERENLTGDRCFTAAHKYSGSQIYHQPSDVIALLDSGAFTHRWDRRLTPEQALLNQLAWEQNFGKKHGFDWWCYAIASYDLLIDEVWVDGRKEKRRWSVADAEEAVKITIDAARYLHSQKQYLGVAEGTAKAGRYLVLGAQGVNHEQYYRCVSEILQIGNFEQVWLGLGGWCILGLPQFRYWIGEFYMTLQKVIPAIASAGVRHVHLYGVLWERALASFAWYCHQYGLTCSTDSKQPILACRSNNDLANKRAGARKLYWRDNVQWWQDKLTNISQSRYYQEPQVYQQLSLFC